MIQRDVEPVALPPYHTPSPLARAPVAIRLVHLVDGATCAIV
jgi:hypothetical protein